MVFEKKKKTIDFTQEEWQTIAGDVNFVHAQIVNNAAPWEIREGEKGLMALRREGIIGKVNELLKAAAKKAKKKAEEESEEEEDD